MKAKLFVLLIMSFFTQPFIYAQCNSGNIILKTQAEVDNFSNNFPGCHRIQGNLEIENTDIENLDGLSVIDSIDGHFYINNNFHLQSLYGLRNLVTVQDLEITNCPMIEDLTGFEDLQEVTNSLFLGNLKIVNLIGPIRLKFIRQLNISNCDIVDLTGIDSLMDVISLTIGNNKVFTSLNGLSRNINLSQVYLFNNQKLTALADLERTSLYSLELRNNPELVDLSGLKMLNEIWFLNIVKNEKLINLNNFNKLNSVRIHIRLDENNSLMDISGLKNINATLLDSIIISNNTQLNHCHIESICQFLNLPLSIARISNNGLECANRLKVEENCLKTNTTQNQFQATNLKPNPAQDYFQIENTKKGSSIEIFDIVGNKVISRISDSYNVMISTTSWLPGIYLVVVNQSQRFVLCKM